MKAADVARSVGRSIFAFVKDPRRMARLGGYIVLSLVTFLFALQATAPYDRALKKGIEAASDIFDITYKDIERGWLPGRVYINNLQIRTRTTKPDEVPLLFTFNRVKLDVGLLALIGKNVSINLDAEIAAGELSGNVTLRHFMRDGVSINLEGEGIPGGSLPLRSVIGLPMSGKVDLTAVIDLPFENGRPGINWKKLDADIDVSCPSGCTFGDNKAKLKPLIKNTRTQAMVGDGIEFGTIKIESLAAKMEIKDGKFTLSKFESKSNDGDVHVDLAMGLAQVFGDSTVTGCLRFKGSESLGKREPKTLAALQATGAEQGTDGLFHIKLAGTWRDMKKIGNEECSGGSAPTVAPAGHHPPPRLTPPPVTPPPTPATAGEEHPPIERAIQPTAPPPPPPPTAVTPVNPPPTAAAPPPPPAPEGSAEPAPEPAQPAP